MDYLKSVEKYLEKAISAKKVEFSINYENCTMYVKTNDKTRDPYIIIKAHELINLVAKGMQLVDAIEILKDDVFSEIVQIDQLVKDQKTLENRRNRLVNPKVLKALQLLSKTKITVSNKHVCIIGCNRGIDMALEVVHK